VAAQGPFNLADMAFSPTAALFEGGQRAGVGFTSFIVRTPPGGGVDLHVHPYSETFILLEGSGRWTAGDDVVELGSDQILVVPANTPHGFRNTGDCPFLLVTVQESPQLEQTFLGAEPA
jgi:mannose-6-phosphate isomerase-like protein (cupin superfamily)